VGPATSPAAGALLGLPSRRRPSSRAARECRGTPEATGPVRLCGRRAWVCVALSQTQKTTTSKTKTHTRRPWAGWQVRWGAPKGGGGGAGCDTRGGRKSKKKGLGTERAPPQSELCPRLSNLRAPGALQVHIDAVEMPRHSAEICPLWSTHSANLLGRLNHKQEGPKKEKCRWASKKPLPKKKKKQYEVSKSDSTQVQGLRCGRVSTHAPEVASSPKNSRHTTKQRLKGTPAGARTEAERAAASPPVQSARL